MDDESGILDLEITGSRKIDPEIRRLAIEVYQETWKEFYIWEQNFSKTALTSLAAINESEPEPKMPLVDDLDDEDFYPELIGSGVTDSFTIEHFDENGECIRYTTVTPNHYPVVGEYFPYPKYEICTPASQNYMPATHIYDTMAAFIPYVDDPEFPVEEYLDSFETFSWQKDFADPDLEIIQLEAVRRLHFYNDFSYEEIDDLDIFPLLRKSSVDGLLWSASQRDIPWRGLADYFDQAPTLPTSFVSTNLDLFSTINQDLPNFCPSLNCLCTFCPTHRTHKYPQVDPVKPKLTSAKLKSSRGKRCSEECFRSIDEEDFPEHTFWEDEDVKTLESILKLMPDQNPCDLAVICRKPCNEVFKYRCTLLPDEDILDGLYREERPARFVMPQFVDLIGEDGIGLGETPKFVPLYPCYHKGPCDQNSTCPCYMEGQHCRRNCRCSIECPIRWKGCDCTTGISGVACKPGSEDCICRLMGRECDPELCVGCDARGNAKRNPPCRNVALQRGVSKNYINIDRSTYGLGAFAIRTIKSGVLIGEYVAEFLSSQAYSHKHLIYEYTKLNYGFELNEHTTLDSAKLGNNTRYLNDARPFGIQGEKENNCEAVVLFVNDDHRIAIVTTREIEATEELLLDYGSKYWQTRDNDENDNQDEPDRTEGTLFD